MHKFNHVQQNIKLAANIREYKSIQHSFKKSVLAKNNTQNLLLLKNTRESEALDRMHAIMDKQGRWERFRTRRTIAIDKYIKQRKLC